MSTRPPPDIAVALEWDGDGAPHVSAKGRGELAAKIIAAAYEHGVPVDDNPVLVELLADVELGQSIPQVLFVAVAEVIAFSYRLQGKLPPQVPGTDIRRDPEGQR